MCGLSFQAPTPFKCVTVAREKCQVACRSSFGALIHLIRVTVARDVVENHLVLVLRSSRSSEVCSCRGIASSA